MIEVTKMFSHYNFCKTETTSQCLQGFQRVKVDEGVKLRTEVKIPMQELRKRNLLRMNEDLAKAK